MYLRNSRSMPTRAASGERTSASFACACYKVNCLTMVTFLAPLRVPFAGSSEDLNVRDGRNQPKPCHTTHLWEVRFEQFRFCSQHHKPNSLPNVQSDCQPGG